MKRMLILLVSLCLVVLTGCATLEPAYQDSHQVMLEKTVETMDVQQALRVKVPKGASVAVVSMETMTTTDHPVIAMVEDGLMELVLKAGYVPLERDAHLLKRLYHEQADGKFGIPVALDSLVVRDPERLIVLDTDLSAADYLVSYRVLEAGIRYGKAESRGKTKRVAMVRLNLRIERAPDGDILWAGEMRGELTDEIESELIAPLSDYHYSFFGHRLPLQKKSVTPRSWWSPATTTATISSASSSGEQIRTLSLGFASPTGDFGDWVEAGPCLAYHWMRPASGGFFLGTSGFFSSHSMNGDWFENGNWMMAEVLLSGRYLSSTGGYGFLGLGVNYSSFSYDEVSNYDYGYYYYSIDDDETNFAWSIGGGYLLNERWDFQALLHSVGSDGNNSRHLTLMAGINF